MVHMVGEPEVAQYQHDLVNAMSLPPAQTYRYPRKLIRLSGIMFRKEIHTVTCPNCIT